MKAFREAVEAWDFERASELLADDVVFLSPATFKPYLGKPITAALLRGVSRVFTDFHYLREINDAPHSALVFEAKVGDVTVNGCDFITVNDDGLISELTVMVRPLKAAHALADAMGAEFEQIQHEAFATMEANQAPQGTDQ